MRGEPPAYFGVHADQGVFRSQMEPVWGALGGAGKAKAD